MWRTGRPAAALLLLLAALPQTPRGQSGALQRLGGYAARVSEPDPLRRQQQRRFHPQRAVCLPGALPRTAGAPSPGLTRRLHAQGVRRAAGRGAGRERHGRRLALHTGACAHAASTLALQPDSDAQIDPGSLTFCTGVSYVSCLRVPVPAAYDKLVSDVRARLSRARFRNALTARRGWQAYALRTTRLRLEFPSASASLCTSAFQTYFCALAFPQCVAIDGLYVELPVCWSYCLQSEMACTSASVATKACTMGVKACTLAASTHLRRLTLVCLLQAGRVAPDRPDVRCMSCATGIRRLWPLLLALCVLSLL